MSVLFPQVRKPREWDYRPIYFDPEKEERKEKLRKLQEQRALEEGQHQAAVDGDFKTSLHRGSFREAAGTLKSEKIDKARQTKAKTYAILLVVLLVVFFYFL